MKNRELVLHKESALIECEGVFSALQRKLYNLLLFNAKKKYYYKDEDYWELNGADGVNKDWNFRNYLYLRENKFNLHIKDLIKYFGNEINENYALKLIKELFNKEIEFNILNKDKSGKWHEGRRFSHAIIEFELRNGTIEYSLPTPIYDVLVQDSDNLLPFAKINLKIATTLQSKYSLIIYELVEDYINSPAIPTINIEKLRKLFGLNEKYEFKNIIARCLKPAIKEINNMNDVPYLVEYEVCRNGRTPTGIKFKIRNKKDDVNTVHVTDSNTLSEKDEQNQILNEKSMTENKVNSVYLTLSHIFSKKNEQNQEVIEKWTPTPELKELAEKFIAAHPNLPADQIKKMKKRYLR